MNNIIYGFMLMIKQVKSTYGGILFGHLSLSYLV